MRLIPIPAEGLQELWDLYNADRLLGSVQLCTPQGDEGCCGALIQAAAF